MNRAVQLFFVAALFIAEHLESVGNQATVRSEGEIDEDE